MRQLLIESYARTGTPCNWLFSRLEDWRYGGNSLWELRDQHYFDDKARLWFDEGDRLLGFWICEYGGNTFCLQPLPGLPEVEQSILAWVLEEWAPGYAFVTTSAGSDDAQRKQLLESYGFTLAGPGEIMREYDLTAERRSPELPAGYSIQGLDDRDDPQRLVEVINAAFGQQLTEHWYHSLMSAPSATAEWWLTLRAPRGGYASFCQAWIDPVNQVAEIDPVGTHPDYQGRGLARLLLRECFHRLGQAGVRLAYIDCAPSRTIADRLYGSLDARRSFPRSTYRYER